MKQQQKRDGDNRASYVEIDDNFDVNFIRIPYNFSTLVNEMKSLGFESYISEGLISGKKIGL